MKATDRAIEIALKSVHSRKITNQLGEDIPLFDNIEEDEIKLLRELISRNNYHKSIEIGCAHGISSLIICASLVGEDTSHTILDPFQFSQYNGIGICQLENSGLTNYTLIQEKSELALPQLLASGNKYDFAFIDGWHTFDHTLIDFFYLNRMLEKGGTIVIDDCRMPSIRQLTRFLKKYPCYKIIGGTKSELSPAQKIALSISKTASLPFRYLLPKRLREHIFSTEFLYPDKGEKLEVSMLALQKVEEDNRPWNWHKKF